MDTAVAQPGHYCGQGGGGAGAQVDNLCHISWRSLGESLVKKLTLESPKRLPTFRRHLEKNVKILINRPLTVSNVDFIILDNLIQCKT